jgi:hypothetical protein
VPTARDIIDIIKYKMKSSAVNPNVALALHGWVGAMKVVFI